MRKLILTVLALALTVLGLAACNPLDEEPTGPSWNPIGIVVDGSIENIKCEEIDSAKSQVDAAIDAANDDEPNEELLKTLGIWKDDSANKLNETALNGDSQAADGSTARKGVLLRLQERIDSDACTKSGDSPSSDGDAGVRDSDGELRSLPLVDQVGPTPAPVDTTSDPRSPATYADAMKCSPVRNWAELVTCIGDQQWYKDGVNARKAKTGFDWNDVETWAKVTDVDARAIHVFNMSVEEKSDEAARKDARALIGDDADKLSVVRHQCIINTRGLEGNKMEDFTDCRKMVRVSLSPLVYRDGQVVGLRADAGIFVDCLNIWWLPQAITKNGPPPPAPPQGTGGGTPPPPDNPPGTVPPPTNPPTNPPPTNPPPTNPPPVCPPGMTGEPPLCKDRESDGPAQVVPEQQRPNPLPVRPDHAQPTRPASPPSVYVPPPAPPVVVVPPNQGGPTLHPTPRPTPPAPETGAPAPTAPETECIPAPGASC